MRCCPPNHLPPEAIRRESEPDDAAVPAARAPDRSVDPLFRQAGIGLDDEG
jgi:polyribonucleotide nucleotidyltransferase